MATEADWLPRVGEVVRVGARMVEFRDAQNGKWYLRPLEGGKEWTADPEDCKPVDKLAALSARVAVVNRQGRERVR